MVYTALARATAATNLARSRLAGILSLRWARPAGVDPTIPAALVLIAGYALPQLDRDVYGVPFWLAWLAAAVLLMGGVRVAVAFSQPQARVPSFCLRRLTMAQLSLVAAVVGAWIVYDVLLWRGTNHLYDLDVYLATSARWLNGGQPYLTATLTSWPSSAAADYFLYPPPLLPLFAMLSQLPGGLVAVAWTGFGLGCWYLALRIVGLTRPVAILMLTFPPLMIGVESGNIAGLTFLLFAAGARAGGTLAVDGLFKVQSGVPMLWLVRTRRWRGLATGIAILAAIVVATLPLVGLDAWGAWWSGLGYRASSQAAAPALYGYSYAQMLSGPVFVAISAAVTLFALAFRGRRGLAALGLASIFASPALWPHGFVFAVPAILTLESGTAVWLVLGIGAFGPNMWLLFGAGWLAVLAARRVPAGSMHPLAGLDSPWPRVSAPARQTAYGPDIESHAGKRTAGGDAG